MGKINKSDVRDADQLQKYLITLFESKNRLYHYTTYESLLHILKDKNVRLSRIDLLNDKAEAKFGISNDWERYYIMSFTEGSEYVSMWSMYGKASGIKLRVDFSKEKFKEAVKDNFYYDKKLNNRIKNTEDSNTKIDAAFSDVVYLVKANNELNHKGNPFPNINGNEKVISEMAGLIKYSAWEFERESRLKVKLTFNELQYSSINYEIPEYIYAAINEDLIQDMHITFNPWLSQVLKDEIKKSLNVISGYNLAYSDSVNDGEIVEFLI